jgi:sulfate adenylyltransferase subunit 1 (EFTu-like GTPase family)
VLVAVNKMDLIGYDEERFRAIERDFTAVLDRIAADTGNPVEPIFVPVNSLKGDNVVHGSQSMPWYGGPPLLGLLEHLPSAREDGGAPFRFPVQRVLRPDRTFRGFAGQIASGTVRAGDKITVLPSGRSAEVARIVTYDGDLDEARAPLSVTLVLDRELDISRGDLIAASDAPATVAKTVKAALVWMDQRELNKNRRYLIKHASQTVPAFITNVEHRTDIATLKHEAAETLEMNGIGVVTLDLLRPIALDLYGENRNTGAFIVIDPETNATAAAGMITAATGIAAAGDHVHLDTWGPVTAGEREARWGHRGGVLELSGPVELIDSIERSLFTAGVVSNRIEAGDEIFLLHPTLLEIVTKLQIQSGLLALVVNANESGTLIARVEGQELTLQADDATKAVSAIHQLLHSAEIFIPSEKAGL